MFVDNSSLTTYHVEQPQNDYHPTGEEEEHPQNDCYPTHTHMKRRFIWRGKAGIATTHTVVHLHLTSADPQATCRM